MANPLGLVTGPKWPLQLVQSAWRKIFVGIVGICSSDQESIKRSKTLMWCFLVDVVSARMKPKPTAAKAGKLHEISILDTSRAGLAMWWKLTWRGTESQPIQLAIFIFTAACGVSSILISMKPYWRVIPYSSPIFYYNGWLNSHWRSPARTSRDCDDRWDHGRTPKRVAPRVSALSPSPQSGPSWLRWGMGNSPFKCFTWMI